jgi:hypothetical protein
MYNTRNYRRALALQNKRLGITPRRPMPLLGGSCSSPNRRRSRSPRQFSGALSFWHVRGKSKATASKEVSKMDDKPSNTVSCYPATKPAPYDANSPPVITTTAGGKPGRWPGAPVPTPGGWAGGPGTLDTGKASKRDGIAKAEASRRQGAVEQGYGSPVQPSRGKSPEPFE